jgi:hypothetical protein
MIGEGAFRADVERTRKLLSDLGLLAYFNQYPSDDARTIRQLREAASYRALYELYLSTNSANVILDDGALLFFRRCPGEATALSYGYLESPFRAPPYSEFLATNFGVVGYESLEAWEDYEVYRSQAPVRTHVVPLRYDWSPDLYREAAHPSSHLHVGHDSEVRVGVDALLTPMQFLLLVLRQFYVTRWEHGASSRPDVAEVARSISMDAVVPQYRQGRDLLELRLISVAAAQPGVAADGASRRR